ncbi:acyl-CoA thioesterase II [Ferrimicrobium sp.]|uniref:acyl-CoA thioesterase n=1 Tax=Ferrimicrobium sp. TaxID=2926050 RepID=UPI00260AA8BB|nr:acyl-CoA thioesterase II [Ferrimicrobium sp.]
MVSKALDDLIALLDLEPIEVNIFRGQSPREDRQRVFGGQVAGQALVAAGRTVSSDRAVHSLHAYFIRPGDPTIPLLYEVERIRDGRSFSTRRVLAIQHGKPIFNLSASFQIEEDGLEHQVEAPLVPDPLSLPDFEETMAPWAESMGEWYDRPRPFDIRYVLPPTMAKQPQPRKPQQMIWLRADGELPNLPLLHACLFAYASDMTLLDSTLLPHQLSWMDQRIFAASLDHAMWFHRRARADDWFLYDMVSPTTQHSRGLAQGRMYDRAGRLLLSVAQEGLIRVRA